MRHVHILWQSASIALLPIILYEKLFQQPCLATSIMHLLRRGLLSLFGWNAFARQVEVLPGNLGEGFEGGQPLL